MMMSPSAMIAGVLAATLSSPLPSSSPDRGNCRRITPLESNFGLLNGTVGGIVELTRVVAAREIVLVADGPGHERVGVAGDWTDAAAFFVLRAVGPEVYRLPEVEAFLVGGVACDAVFVVGFGAV